jgi:hypothetical protein
MFRRAVFTIWVVLVSAVSAAAQDHGTVGLSMGFPTSVGVIFHATDKVAIRPEVNFRRTSVDVDVFGIESTRSTTQWTFALSGLFYVKNWDRLRTYVSPRYSYDRGTFSDEASGNDSSGSVHAFAGSFGAQYSLDRRFNIFGEVGFGYASADADLDDVDGASRSWNTRSAVGVILYFK